MGLSNREFLLAALVVMAALVGNAAAATYVVGDSLGWSVPTNATVYPNWAAQHQFTVGDVLVFNFTTGQHDVAQVTNTAFDGCSSNNALSLATVGPTNITLRTAGPAYYICTFGSHCSLGQKLAINVSASATAPAPITPTPAPITPTPAPKTPTPTPSGSPAPAPAIPSPRAAPGPSPSGGMSPPPKVPGEAPGSTASPGAGGASPPPSPPAETPSSATVSKASGLLVGFALVAVGMMV